MEYMGTEKHEFYCIKITNTVNDVEQYGIKSSGHPWMISNNGLEEVLPPLEYRMRLKQAKNGKRCLSKWVPKCGNFKSMYIVKYTVNTLKEKI